MLWASVRTGWGNTGFIAALALLPLVSLVNPSVQTERPRVAIAAASVDAITLARAPVTERGSD
jgi:hypothetical protein